MRNKVQAGMAWFASATGAVVPAWAFFKNYAPPIFPAIGIILTPLSAALIYIVAAYGLSRAKLLKYGIVFLSIGVMMIFAYVVTLPQWTVLDPQSYSVRFQVGFGVADWSLTQVGSLDKRAIPSATTQDLMMAENAFHPGGPDKIWRAWSIVAAGSFLLLMYFFGFTCWVLGFACLAKHKGSG